MPSDFFSPPLFGRRTNSRATQLAGITVSLQTRTLSAGFRSVYDIEQNIYTGVGPTQAGETLTGTPWGRSYGGDASVEVVGPGTGQAVAQAQAALAMAQSAFTQAKGQRDVALAVLAAAQTDFLEKVRLENLAKQGVWAAKHRLAILTGRQADAEALAQASAQIVVAQQALGTASTARATAEDAFGQAQTDATEKQALVYNRAGQVAVRQVELTDATHSADDAAYNYSSFQAANPNYGTGTGQTLQVNGYVVRSAALNLYDGLAKGAAVAGNTFYALGPSYYGGGQTDGNYRVEVSVSRSVAQELIDAGAVLRVRWAVLDRRLPTRDRSGGGKEIDPTAAVQESATEQDEDIDLAGLTPGDDGVYRVYGSVHAVTAPSSGGPTTAPSLVSCVSVAGPRVVPQVQIYKVSSLGATRYRQGFAEYQTAPGQAQAARYLRVTASKVPGYQGPADYSGFLEFQSYDPESGLTYLPTTSYEPDTAPLGIVTTLSPDCGEPFRLVDALKTPFEGARVLSPTVRDMAQPPGLRLTLSQPVTPSQVASSVDTVVDADWPDPPTGTATLAREYHSADGDAASRQRFRYKLAYFPGDTRPDGSSEGFTATFRFGIRTRNLVTGAVHTEVQTVLKSFPSGQVDENGTLHRWDAFDASWTEITALAQSEVSLVSSLPGENPTGRTYQGFGAAGTFEVRYPSDDDGED